LKIVRKAAEERRIQSLNKETLKKAREEQLKLKQ
jgi:hypothetical protein